MPIQFSDEYALALDSLSVALQNSYSDLKEASLSREDLDYSRLIVNRLRAFYCAQDKIKKILDKQVAQAGADFFVEAILFSLKLFNEVEGLKLEVASERAIQRKRNAIRPDISIWRGDTLFAAIECKTQLGWRRHDWAFHFDEREKKTKRNLSNCDNVSVGDDRL